MLDMGFIPDVKRVLARCRRSGRTCCSRRPSPTRSASSRTICSTSRVTIDVAPRNSTVDAIAQRVHPVNRDQKAQLLAYLIGQHRWEQVLVFTRTKHGADKLVRSLEADGIRGIALHGNKSQNARTKALADFKSGAVRVMVATDIAARGIDIDQLPARRQLRPSERRRATTSTGSGAPGRAGAEGEAISLVCVDEHVFLRDIERLLKRQIPVEIVPGFEPDPNAKPQAVFVQRGRGRPGQGQGPRQGAGPGRGAERNSRSFGSGHKPAGGNARSRNGGYADRGNAGHGRGAPRQGARAKAA